MALAATGRTASESTTAGRVAGSSDGYVAQGQRAFRAPSPEAYAEMSHRQQDVLPI